MMAAARPGEDVLARVMESYRRAWETRDAELAASLFTDDATYQEDPFREPFAGPSAICEYWRGATQDQHDIRFTWREIARSGALHVAEWEAEFRRTTSGKRVALRGVMLIELSGGRIARFREFWHREEREPLKNRETEEKWQN